MRLVILMIEVEQPEGISARKLILEAARHNVLTAYSGRVGIELLRQSSSDPGSNTSPWHTTHSAAPAALDAQTEAGLYAGSTSSAFHFFGLKVSCLNCT